jgi:hypothetical protein
MIDVARIKAKMLCVLSIAEFAGLAAKSDAGNAKSGQVIVITTSFR